MVYFCFTHIIYIYIYLNMYRVYKYINHTVPYMVYFILLNIGFILHYSISVLQLYICFLIYLHACGDVSGQGRTFSFGKYFSEVTSWEQVRLSGVEVDRHLGQVSLRLTHWIMWWHGLRLSLTFGGQFYILMLLCSLVPVLDLKIILHGIAGFLQWIWGCIYRNTPCISRPKHNNIIWFLMTNV